ncbi:6-bladed beta-propeller [Portibacter lacus]|uniref:Peptidylglycine monooxygenase n=1 Tax=Portibacter lacus TaxID=1099794 RepID=A0AA37WDE1_9BACT|nr:6-bladed beta-propeller [Portibacter lacus]GLR15852.1 peptidylglycine monooxygenase [Portibacter lacus]
MERRNFIKNTMAFSVGASTLYSAAGQFLGKQNMSDVIVGHGDYKYKIDMHWGSLNSQQVPVKNCHEMVQDSMGRIILLTDHTKNNVIIYDKSGKLIETWGTDYPGAHGLTINNEGGEDFLYICDNSLHCLIKTDLKGNEIFRLPYPKETGLYASEGKYVPTESAIAANGDIYISDGYGSQYIIQYNHKGELIRTFGGRGDGPEHFDNAHGIAIDTRNGKEELMITARKQNKFKKFTMDGKLIEVIDLPGAWVCRPVIHGDDLYVATIWSGEKVPNSGFVSILNKENKLVSAPCGSIPTYENGKLNPVYQTLNIFQHPHDVCIDEDDSIYVAQWNSGNVYPIKLTRV